MTGFPSLYTFGTMSLGKDPAFPEADLAVTRRAMEAGVWFHSSPTYNNGFTFMVLRMAFEADRLRRPRVIIKIRDGSVDLMRFEVEDSCRRLGIDSIDIAQLVSMSREPGNLVDQLCRGGGPLVKELESLRSRGLIRKAVLFLDRGNSETAVEAAGHPLIDGVTLYWNLLQRDCSPRAWEGIRAASLPVLALRTLGGWRDSSLQPRREAMQTCLEGADPVKSALDLAASEPLVQTTIGGTASLPHLEAYLAAAGAAKALPEPLLARINAIRIGDN